MDRIINFISLFILLKLLVIRSLSSCVSMFQFCSLDHGHSSQHSSSNVFWVFVCDCKKQCRDYGVPFHAVQRQH